MVYLPAEQLHSRANSLVAKFQVEHGGGTSCIDEATVLNCEALGLFGLMLCFRRLVGSDVYYGSTFHVNLRPSSQ